MTEQVGETHTAEAKGENRRYEVEALRGLSAASVLVGIQGCFSSFTDKKSLEGDSFGEVVMRIVRSRVVERNRLSGIAGLATGELVQPPFRVSSMSALIGVSGFERFFRETAGLDADKDDLKRYSDFINQKVGEGLPDL